MDALARIRRATATRARTEAAWRDAIRDAHTAGDSLRVIANAAGVTHVRVLHIIRGDPPKDPEYARQHRAVEKARGKAKECSRCGTTDPEKVYEWANLTGNYADVSDYERMCRKCHRAYDRERRQVAPR